MKPNLQIFRAKFSEITPNSIRRACETLTEPDCNISDAVDVRQELDLRIGEAAAAPLSRRTWERLQLAVHHHLITFHSSVCLLIVARCVLYPVPDASPAEDLPRVSGQSADLIRQLSVSHAGICGGALQSHSGFYTRDFLQDQRYEFPYWK